MGRLTFALDVTFDRCRRSWFAICVSAMASMTMASCATDGAAGDGTSPIFTFDATVTVGSGIEAVAFQGSNYLPGDAVAVHATYADYDAATAARDLRLDLTFAAGTNTFVVTPSCGESYGEPISERDEDRIDVLGSASAPSFAGQGSCSTGAMVYGWTN